MFLVEERAVLRRVGLPVLVSGLPDLQIPCPAGFQGFQSSGCPPPDVGSEAFFGLAFVAELEGAQFALDIADAGVPMRASTQPVLPARNRSKGGEPDGLPERSGDRNQQHRLALCRRRSSRQDDACRETLSSAQFAATCRHLAQPNGQSCINRDHGPCPQSHRARMLPIRSGFRG